MLANVLKRVKKDEKGFTLIELLAVIVILGVIAAIAVPLISNIISKSKTDSDIATARQIVDAARLYITAEGNGDFTDTTVTIISSTATDSTLVSKGYLSGDIVLPSTKSKIDAGTVTFDVNGNISQVVIGTVGATTNETFDAAKLK